MGGFGSTRWAWTRTSDTAESERSLNINRLNRAGCLRPGSRGGWEWKRDGARVADIVFRATVDQLTLSYRVRKQGGEWRDVDQPTQILWVTCRFGGRWPYFLCPGRGCGRLVSKLYGAGTYFLCRHCYRLAYASQRENQYDRALRRTNNIRMRLGGKQRPAWPFPERPKGMHEKTYQRLYSEARQAEMLAAQRLGLTLERLKSRPLVHVIRRRSSKKF
jgi:hypothetical protein